MSKFKVDDKVVVTFTTANNIMTKHNGTVLEVITAGQYAGHYRVAMVDWLTSIMPEETLELANG